MRGRRPKPLTISAEDRDRLERLAHSRSAPWFAVQRARAVLGIAGGERVGTVAEQLRCDPSTVWRVCRRFESGGVRSILAFSPGRAAV